jgi:hypothetical protein
MSQEDNQDHTQEKAEFIFSQKKVSSEIQKRVINLGKEIVQELELEPGVDTLSKWMAYYISEQIVIAENSTGEDEERAKQKCFDTILKLWVRRGHLPDGSRPFEDFEQIFHVLKKIDPEDNTASFYQLKDFKNVKEEKDLESEVEFWINKVELINNSAKILLRFCLAQAFENAKNKNVQSWLENSIDSAPTYDLKSVKILERFYEEFNQQETEADKEKKKLKALLEDSEVLLENLQELREEIKAELKS